jgi:formylglycine-generating enzyme required for sulfatase activity
MIMMDWFMAAAYCNWLSKEEGFPKEEWCYPEKVVEGMVLPDNFLERTGYRLPTEAEWEYACRAGAQTCRFYGREPALMEKYAWFSKNTNSERTEPGGMLRPNDLGLFDLYGNVWEWCQDKLADYPTGDVVVDLYTKDTDITAKTNRMVRGGGFLYSTRDMRSAYRYYNRASTRIRTLGLRPARTYRPGEPRP